MVLKAQKSLGVPLVLSFFFVVVVVVVVDQSFATTTTYKKLDRSIEHACKTSTDRDLCTSMLTSPPRSIGSELKRLGHMLLEDSLAKGEKNFALVKKLYGLANDRAVKTCLKLCLPEYQNAIGNLKTAIRLLESDDLHKAGSNAMSAGIAGTLCQEWFDLLRDPHRSPLTEENKDFVRLALISHKVILLADNQA